MKKKFLYLLICLFSLIPSNIMFLKENISFNNEVNKRKMSIDKKKFELEEKKIVNLQNQVSEYLKNPDQFISANTNKDNFIAVFSNFTQVNGEILYDQYIHDRHNKDIQNLIDHLNNFQSNNYDKWTYDTISNKFILPEEMRKFSDYFKWKIIISILKNMEKFPIQKTTTLNSKKHFLFPEDVKILNPPI